jgi:NDP-sugar pyrophosphorylase family protein
MRRVRPGRIDLSSGHRYVDLAISWQNLEGRGRYEAVILAGGLGTPISEESHLRREPMIEIGGIPILWHIMKIFAAHGVRDFVVCCGCKGYVTKNYFANYFLHMTDATSTSLATKWRYTRTTRSPGESL